MSKPSVNSYYHFNADYFVNVSVSCTELEKRQYLTIGTRYGG